MSHALRPAALLALAGACALGASRLWNPARASRAVESAAVLPARAGEFVSGGEEPVDPVVRAALSTASVRRRTYLGPSGATVEATLIVGGDRTALHDPRSCMVGAGWRIEDDRTETLPTADVAVRRCTLAGSLGRFDALYLYVTEGGDSVASPTAIRWQMLSAALRGGRERPVRFLRLLQPAGPGSADRLSRLAAALWPSLSGSGRQP